jgi:D-beta-D-heptose 7-phosphate kinase/D-beta-D-heptose 1-phosphate adenosyltransferase
VNQNPPVNQNHIEKWAQRRVLVLGDAILDAYHQGTSSRLCQEAPVPIVDLCAKRLHCGGAANVAANVAALGALPTLLSVTGEDADGRCLRELSQQVGCDTRLLLADPQRQTLAKQRVLADGQIIVRFDQGSTSAVTGFVEEQLLRNLTREFFNCEAVIVSDYGYGVVTDRIIDCLARLQARSGRIVVVDARDARRYRALGATAMKPNFGEACALLGLRSGAEKQRAEFISAHASRLLETTGARLVAVSLDCDGAVLLGETGCLHQVPARPAPDAFTSGAGDTFTAALALGLLAGGSDAEALELASSAAAVVVANQHTRVCSHRNLLEQTGAGQVVSDLVEISQAVRRERELGRSIVLTNGCFDILHSGHIAYLKQAKRLGDVLVVGLNTDESIRRIKGPERPINSLCDRIDVVAGLQDVDHVASFGEDTPCRLIEAVRPDVFVKGGDYTRATLPEAELVERLGGRVVLLPYVAQRSTTGLINRIRTTSRQPVSFA